MIQAIALVEDLVLEAAGKRHDAWLFGVFRQIVEALLIGGRRKSNEESQEEESEIHHDDNEKTQVDRALDDG